MVLVRFAVTTVTVPAALSAAVWFTPPFILYVTIALGVPLKIILVEVPLQIATVPLIVAVGRALTNTTAAPDAGCVHTGMPVVAILTRLYVAATARLPVAIVAVPLASNPVVWLTPPLIL